MATRVTKDTFMYEAVGPDQEVRRQVFAGQFVPDHYHVGEDTNKSAIEQDVEGPAVVGFGAAPHGYPEQHEDIRAELAKTRSGRGSKGGKSGQES